jgi:hypothetical protein
VQFRQALGLVRPDDRLAVLYPLFTRTGVRLPSGFFGPVERGLRAAGHAGKVGPSVFATPRRWRNASPL